MGRRKKYPELQTKFERFLASLRIGKVYSTNELLNELKNNKSDFNISDEEYSDLENNSANYIYRAKKDALLISLGTRKGYKVSLNNTEISETDELESIDDLQEKPSDQDRKTGNQNWESLLHFITTLLLSKEFNALIKSLPPSTNRLKWANPDCIMIRDYWSDGESKYDFKRDLLNKVDSSPDYILSSIELKFNIGNTRSNILNALAETAINGGWANENWLVFMNGDTIEDETKFDNDSLDFAKRNGIGIIEIVFDEADGGGIRLDTHLTAKKHHTVRFNSDFAQSGNKGTLLKEIEEIIETYTDNGSYLDEDGNYIKLGELLFQAYENVEKQPGFTGKLNFKEGVSNLDKNNPKLLRTLLKAIYAYLPDVIEETMKEQDLLDSYEKNTIESDVSTKKRQVAIDVLSFLKEDNK